MSLRVRVGEFKVDGDIRAAVNRVVDSGRISEGPETRDFESNFAAYIGTKHAVATNSGTSALIAALLVAKARLREKGIEPKKVMTTPLTYIATANAIVIAGMEPVFADVEPETFCLDPESVRRRLEEEPDDAPSILLPVHLMGYVADMGEMGRIAKKHGMFLIEDSSQAHGSVCNGSKAGSMSEISTFSFYIAHNIQAGELGAVLTNDVDVARRIRKIKANGRLCDCVVCTRAEGKCPKFNADKPGWDPRFLHDEIGFNFKTMEFPAAIASAQISRADEIARRRRQNVKTLNELMKKHSDVLTLPRYSDDISYLGYPLVIRDSSKLNRESVQLRLEKNGVETRPLFGCIPLHQPSFKHLKSAYAGRLPNAERIGSDAFYIGCHQYLTDDDLRFVASAFDALRG